MEARRAEMSLCDGSVNDSRARRARLSAVENLPTKTDGCLNAITDIQYLFNPQWRSQIINVGARSNIY